MINLLIKIGQMKVFRALVGMLALLAAGNAIMMAGQTSKLATLASGDSQSSEAFSRGIEDIHTQEETFAGIKPFVPNFETANYQRVYMGEKAVVWVLATEESVVYEEQGQAIEEGILKVEDYFKTTFEKRFDGEKKIYFFYGATDIARILVPMYDRPVVLMPLRNDRNSFRAYVHESVHLITGYKRYLWLEEGLAVYLNDYLGGGENFPNSGYDIDQLARRYGEAKPVIEWIGAGYNPQINVKTSNGRLFYIYSGSFVKYLVENMGRESFLEFFNQNDVLTAIKNATSKDIAQWKREWIASVLSKN